MTTDARQPVMYFGTCRSCGSGLVRPRRCGVCEKIVLHCSECDAAWVTPSLDLPPLYLTGDNVACPHCAGDLNGNGSRLATLEDLANCEWVVAAIADRSLALTVDGW